MKTKLLIGICTLTSITGLAADNIATLRNADIVTEPEAPRMERVLESDSKRYRNYPMQPPTIPHKVEGYRVDLNSNKCLSCHSRRRVEESQAPMVSVTHYMDRDGNFLAEVSPRRYFCNQCHVPLTDARLTVKSVFQDMDKLIRKNK